MEKSKNAFNENRKLKIILSMDLYLAYIIIYSHRNVHVAVWGLVRSSLKILLPTHYNIILYPAGAYGTKV